MGWAGGSTVANSIWDEVRPRIKPNVRRVVAKAIVNALNGADWDTHDEAPLLIADAGEATWVPESDKECSFCGEPAVWTGKINKCEGYHTCNLCVVDLEEPEMIS